MNKSFLIAISLIIILLVSCRNRTSSTNKEKEPGRKISVLPSDTIPDKLVPLPVVDIEGNEYPVIKIGNQSWFLKNLKTTVFNDGSPISLVSDSAAWTSLSAPGYCWYENEMATFKPSYGALYNGYAVNTGKLCPKDWHVPSDADWTILTNFLGGEAVAGGKLKEQGTSYWVVPNTGATNESGFTALPGGLRYHDGRFHDFGFSGYWWSSTTLSNDRAFFRYLDYEYTNVLRFDNLMKIGFSVRCVRDF